jgi:CRISPR-associated endoribonuclease Cas6
MRIYLKLSSNFESVPFEHNAILTGILNRWISDAKIHDNLSLYSFSGLRGGIANKDSLNFPQGGEWFISAYDSRLILKIIQQIKIHPYLAFGMMVKEIMVFKTPIFTTIERFKLATPVFIKRTVGRKCIHYLFNNYESDHLLTETMKNKLDYVGIHDELICISFDRSYKNPKTKLISYKGINNRVNWCPIIIKGKPETIAFAWQVGIGNSTGIGFGSLI